MLLVWLAHDCTKVGRKHMHIGLRAIVGQQCAISMLAISAPMRSAIGWDGVAISFSYEVETEASIPDMSLATRGWRRVGYWRPEVNIWCGHVSMRTYALKYSHVALCTFFHQKNDCTNTSYTSLPAPRGLGLRMRLDIRSVR